jgi:hypothetical protein
MADRAAFSQGGVFENKGPGLLPMTLRAIFVHPGHGQATGRLHNIAAVRIMALNTTYLLLQHGVMLRKMKFHFRRAVTLEAGNRIFAGVQNKLSRTPAGNVQTARAVTRFTTGLTYPGI